jgi:hypothetical protein
MSSTFIIKYGKLQQWDHFEKSAQWSKFFSQIPEWFSRANFEQLLKWFSQAFSRMNLEQAPKWFKTMNSAISFAKNWTWVPILPLTFWNAFNSTALPGVHVVGPEGPVRVNSIFDALS